jgi:hypothetical protein
LCGLASDGFGEGYPIDDFGGHRAFDIGLFDIIPLKLRACLSRPTAGSSPAMVGGVY